MNNSTKLEIDVAKMQENIKAICESVELIRKDICELRQEIRDGYVTNERFKPIESFYKGMLGAGVVLIMGVVGLMVTHVIPGLSF